MKDAAGNNIADSVKSMTLTEGSRMACDQCDMAAKEICPVMPELGQNVPRAPENTGV